jgi:hypothetical protein
MTSDADHDGQCQHSDNETKGGNRRLPCANCRTAFETYRDYVKHEDALIRDRLTWMIAVQGLLMAALALVVVKMVELIPTANPYVQLALLAVLVLVLALVGDTTSSISTKTVRAAESAHKALEKRWHELRVGCKDSLPGLTYGDDDNVQTDRHSLASHLPSTFGKVWGSIALSALLGIMCFVALWLRA